jgi:hypothetical protein
MANKTEYEFSPWGEAYMATGEDGPYTAIAWTVACTHTSGRRWLYVTSGTGPSGARAAELAAMMTDRVTPTWTPTSEFWAEGPVVYGSARHEEIGDVGLHADIEPEMTRRI